MNVKENSAKPGKKLWITPWLILFGIYFVLLIAAIFGFWFLLASAMVLWLFHKNQKYDLFHLQQTIQIWVEQTEQYKNLKNPAGISSNKHQAFQSAHKPQGFFSQLFATAFGIVFGVVILLVLGMWLLSLIAPPAGTPVQGNTINTQTENAQGVVDNVNRLNRNSVRFRP